MDWDFGFNLIFLTLLLAVLCLAIIFLVLICLVVQERTLILDCLNNGGHWLTNYAIGCTYPMG